MSVFYIENKTAFREENVPIGKKELVLNNKTGERGR